MVAHVFLLNLDADLELGTRGPYTPSDRVKRAALGPRAVIARTLVPEGHFVATEESVSGAFSGLPARAFCPTENARREAARLGVDLGDVPGVDVLRAVARRDFGYLPELPGSFVSDDAARVLDAIAEPPPLGDGWRLKRAYGMASRGHRVIRGAVTETDRAFIHASAEALIVEPNVRIHRELGLHGFLERDGSFVRGAPTEQIVDAFGAWRQTRVLGPHELDDDVREALTDTLARAACLLHDAAYFGPFGLDAFAYESSRAHAFRTCSEIHARYSMGWGFAFSGLPRPDLS